MEEPAYARAWRDYRGRVAMLLVAFVALPTASAPIAKLFRGFLGRGDADTATGVAGCGLFAVVCVAWIRLLRWRCPRRARSRSLVDRGAADQRPQRSH